MSGTWRFIFILLPASRDRDPSAAVPCPDCGLYRFYHDALRGGWFVRGTYD